MQWLAKFGLCLTLDVLIYLKYYDMFMLDVGYHGDCAHMYHHAFGQQIIFELLITETQPIWVKSIDRFRNMPHASIGAEAGIFQYIPHSKKNGNYHQKITKTAIRLTNVVFLYGSMVISLFDITTNITILSLTVAAALSQQMD
ncbi:hypothetical protein ACJX0J_027701 [Zea mays]